MGWTAGFPFTAGAGIFLLPPRPDPPSLISNGYRSSLPGLKRQGRVAGHSPPSSAEIKDALSYTSTPQYIFIAW